MTQDEKMDQIIDKFHESLKIYSKNESKLGIGRDGQELLNIWVFKKLAQHELEINELKDKLVNT